MYENIEEMHRSAERKDVPNSKSSTCYWCNRLYFTEKNINLYTGSFTTRALEKKRKQEIAFGCVVLKKKKSSLKDIREKTT
jgi:hypothetical protein